MPEAYRTHIAAAFAAPGLHDDPADTSITAATFDQANEAAARLLPPGWFRCILRADIVAGQHYDHLAFLQTDGVPVGDYAVHREPSRQFSLFCLAVEPDEAGNQIERELGLFGSMEGAVAAIRDDLRLTAADLQERAHRWWKALAA